MKMKQTPFLFTTLAIFAGGVAATAPFQSHRLVAFITRGGVLSDEVSNVEEVADDAVEAVEKGDENKPNDEEEQPDEACVGDACSVRGGATDATDATGATEDNGLSDEEDYEEYEDVEAEEEEELSADEVFEDAFEELDELEGAESYVEEEVDAEEAVEESADEEELAAEAVDEGESEVADEEIQADASEEGEFGFQTEVIQHNTDDGDSSAFVDREELADAYDDDETALGATAFRAGHTDDDDRVSIDDVPDAAEPIQEYEQGDADEPVEDEEETPEEEAPNEEESSETAVETPGISAEVEKILIEECGFHKSELRGMKPEIANVMAEKRLRRPVEGIPPSWYEEKKRGTAMAIVGKVLKVALPVALAGLAAFGVTDVSKLMSLLKSNEDSVIEEKKEEKPLKDMSELAIPSNETSTAAPAVAAADEPKETKGPLGAIPGLGGLLKRFGLQS